MKITFLGTGTSQGIPVIGCTHEVCLSTDLKDNRLRSSVLIQWDEYNYVIDCGPDFRQQMLNANVNHLAGIIFTHFHADHTAGLDEIRPYSHAQGGVNIYAENDVVESLKERYDYIFRQKNRYLGAPSVIVNKVENKPFILGSRRVDPIEVMHGALKIFGYRFGDIAYLTDVKSIENTEKQKIQNLEILVINALRIEAHPTHLCLQEALDLIQELKPKKAYLTHISHKLGFHAEVSKNLPKNVFLAYDGLSLELP